MANNLEKIKKTEQEADKLVAAAFGKGQKIKHGALEKADRIKHRTLDESEKESAAILEEALKEAQKEGNKILAAAKKQSEVQQKIMESNLEKASDFIIKRISGGSC